MSNKQYPQVSYLAKIIVGLLVVISTCIVAILLPESGFSGAMYWGIIASLILIFILLFALVYFIYGKMDELQKRLHEYASVLTTTLIISISGILGVLQATHFLPLFNQFWTLALSVIIWAIALSVIDKLHK